MFDKETEIYALSNYGFRGKNSQRVLTAKIDYQNGAEFGYNKANEWHYVKDGKYPKENQLVMLYRVNPLGANIAITNWYDSYKNTRVIAWKEVLLPELKESE